jgi:hypothetical protein
MNFAELVTSSVLTRALAIVILALTAMLAIVIVGVELMQGQQPNPVLWTVAGIGLGQAGAILHINYGVLLQQTPKGETIPDVKQP